MPQRLWAVLFALPIALASQAVLVAGVGAQATPAQAQATPVVTAPAQEQPRPVARPDLALALRDLPPGYEEDGRLGSTSAIRRP